jgi:hypothetical protein
MKVPKRYLTKNPGVMKKEIKKHGKKDDKDSSAYKEWDADYKSKKAGKGKKVPTKTSPYTKKFKELYDSEELEGMKKIVDYEEFGMFEDAGQAAYEVFQETGGEEIPDEDTLDESSSNGTEKALKGKAKKTGIPLGILRQVYRRGVAAWKTGHVPGTTPQQWGMGRVNSFAVGGKTTKMADKALYQRAKEARAKKKK